MATTQDELNSSADEFSAAFNEDMPERREQGEDEAFGLNLPASEGDGATTDTGEGEGEPAVAIVIEGEGEGDKNAAAEASAESANDAANEGAGPAADVVASEGGDGGEPAASEPAADPGADLEKERQRLKSWEGRLKALAAKLEGTAPEVESAPAEALEETAEAAEAKGNTELAAAAEEASDKVESGEMSAEQAMQMLAEDFGPEFVKMIEAIATAKAREAGEKVAGEKIGELGKTVEDIISDISDSKTRMHFERIHDAHPDFVEVSGSPAFAAFVDEDPERKNVVENGDARSIVKLLDDFKKSAASAEPEAHAADAPAAAAAPAVDEGAVAAMDDAEGVRSGPSGPSGLSLPEKPTANGYEEAWDQF